MPKTQSQPTIEQFTRFRLKRHHLSENEAADAVTICRDVCGVQAQVMSAAYLQLWARNHDLTRSEIEGLLWKSRTLVKTSLMRQTLHLIPSDEFWLYITALKPSRLAGPLRIMSKFGIDRAEAEDLTLQIMNVLSDGPCSRGTIHQAVRPKVSKRVRAWMEKVWSIMRLPVAEGLICYGSGENSEVNFIRVDHWLPKQKPRISLSQAQATLFSKYLRAYGPATLSDFAHWSGISMQEIKALPPPPESQLAEISVDHGKLFLLREDVAELKRITAITDSIRLLPSFDIYLLAHREKDHLLSAQHYKRVYRNQGWLSPVVLINGAIAGVWSYKLENKKVNVMIEPFRKLLRPVREGIAEQAESLAMFFKKELELKIG